MRFSPCNMLGEKLTLTETPCIISRVVELSEFPDNSNYFNIKFMIIYLIFFLKDINWVWFRLIKSLILWLISLL